MESLPKLNDVERLSSRVVRILGQNPSPYTLQGTNSYVIGTGSCRILLDTTSPASQTAESGGTQKYVSNLRQFLTEEKAKISQIVVSHRHFDHVGAIGEILHDSDIVNDVSSTKCSKHESYKHNEYTTPINWHYLTDGEQFSSDGATLTAVFTPGHTDDHVSFLLEEENVLFTGDTILGHGTTIAEHLDRYITTLERIRSLNNQRKFCRLYPAHGGIIDGVEVVAQKIEAYLKHRLDRIEQVHRSVCESSSDSVTIDYLIEKVYPTVTGMLIHGARNNLLQSLQLLVDRGEIDAIPSDQSDVATMRWRPKSVTKNHQSKL